MAGIDWEVPQRDYEATEKPVMEVDQLLHGLRRLDLLPKPTLPVGTEYRTLNMISTTLILIILLS